MLRVWLLFTILAFSCLFLIYRPTGEIGYLFADFKWPADTYFYLLFEHITWIIASWIMWDQSEKFSNMFALFFWIQVLDMIFYILFYKSPWIGPLPWNALKVLIFGGFTTRELWKIKQ